MSTLKILLHGKEVASIRLEPGQEYVFGRANSCTVQLQDQPGISRKHFKISFDNEQWTARVTSKFGEIIYTGQPVGSVELSEGTVFKLAGYDFLFIQADQLEEAAQVHIEERLAVGAEPSTAMPTTLPTNSDEEGYPNAGPGGNKQQPPTMSLVPSDPSAAPQGSTGFQGNDDATNVGAALPGRPSLRIVKASGTELRVDLDGKKWLAGREDTCDIFLPDRKASRRQFEINSTPEGYFITDLGSANGTVLNGDPLIPEDPRQLKSGDVIGVQSLLIYFEIRDPNFEKRLVAIAPEMLAAPALPALPRFEIINYPANAGHGGAVRVDSEWAEGRRKPKKNNLLRVVLVTFIAIAALYAMFGQQDDVVKQPGNTALTGINRLNPQQRQMVKELYVTARNLYMQGKFENTHEQLKKLHEILPEGYEGSKPMEEDCLAQRAAAEQLNFAIQEKNRVEEQKRMIDRNIRECNLVANRSLNIEEIRNCLAPTIGLDPSNPLVADLIGRVERRANDRSQKAASQRDYADRVSRGRALYQKSVDLQKSSDWYGAIDAFNRHIQSIYPDPDGLKTKSQTAIGQIKSLLASRVDELLQTAQTAYQARNFKEALEAAKKARDFDPQNQKAVDFQAKVRKELNAQLRTLYEDAILYEGVGQVKAAQDKWKAIIERDTTDGEYYQKSKLKLKNYSDQGS